MKRVRTRVGNVFCARLDKNRKKYFQYIARDMSQLDSDVVRAFKRSYSVDETPDLRVVVADEVDFYAHVIVQWGIKMNLWEKVGHVSDVGGLDVLFRDTDDCGVKEGEEPVKVSTNWYVWRINKNFQHVGKLKGAHRDAEIGVVVAPPDIVDRMRTGEYDFLCPGYE